MRLNSHAFKCTDTVQSMAVQRMICTTFIGCACWTLQQHMPKRNVLCNRKRDWLGLDDRVFECGSIDECQCLPSHGQTSIAGCGFLEYDCTCANVCGGGDVDIWPWWVTVVSWYRGYKSWFYNQIVLCIIVTSFHTSRSRRLMRLEAGAPKLNECNCKNKVCMSSVIILRIVTLSCWMW